MKTSKRQYSDFLVDWPRLVISFFVVLTALCAWFVPRFEIDASADTLLTRDNRLYIESRLANERFSPDEFVLVGYRPHDGELFSPESLSDIQALTFELGTLERVETVNSILSVPLISSRNEYDTSIDPAQWTWESRRFSAAEMRAILTDHPIFSGLLVNEALTATAIQVVFRGNPELADLESEILQLETRRLQGEADEQEQATLAQLEAMAEPLRAELASQREQEIDRIYRIVAGYEERADLFPGGVHVLAAHLIDLIRHDLVLFGSAIAVAICLLLLLLFRDVRWMLIPVVCCAASVLITMGLFGFLGLKTTVISANFVALQLILTLALAIHLIVQYRVFAAEGRGDNRHLLKLTLREKIRPSFYAGLTTSVGFASLLFSGIQPVISFGWMMVVAMLTSITVCLGLFPAMAALSGKVLPHAAPRLAGWILDGFRRTLRRPVLVMLGGLALLLVSLGGMARLEVENSFLDYFRDSTRISRELHFIDRELGGSTPLDIIYRAPAAERSEGLVASAETIRTLESIQSSLQSSRAVGSAMSVVNFTELARQINDGQPLTEYELNSLYALLDAGIREELVGSYVNAETGEFRISLRVIDSTPGLNRAEFLAAVRQTLRDIGVAEENVTVTNLFVLYQDILERLFRSQIQTMGLVFLALGLVLLAVFRSPRLAVVTLVPNIIPTLLVLGAMGWLSIPLDLMTITIAAVAMGIAVDDTIHFTHHYLKTLDEDPGSAIQTSFRSVGHAMLYTTLVIALGFSILGLSDFMPSVVFGLLTALAMLVALLTDLTLLPVLLEKFVRPSRLRASENGMDIV